MAENKLFVSCNICGDAVEGIAYATRCHHFLCLKCAKKTFNTSKSCPVCNFTLSKADLIELSVGILPSSNITESVYHCVYSSKEWSQTLENLSSAMNSVKHATDFAAHQVLMEMKKSSQLAASLTNDIEQYRHELAKQEHEVRDIAKAYDDKLRTEEESSAAKDATISELTREIREALRKSGAWEKAYCNLRDQVTNRNVGQGSLVGQDSIAPMVHQTAVSGLGPALSGPRFHAMPQDSSDLFNQQQLHSGHVGPNKASSLPSYAYQQPPGNMSRVGYSSRPSVQSPILPQQLSRSLNTGGSHQFAFAVQQQQQQPQQQQLPQQHISHGGGIIREAVDARYATSGQPVPADYQPPAVSLSSQQQSVHFKYRRQNTARSGLDDLQTSSTGGGFANKENSAFSVVRHGEWKLMPDHTSIARNKSNITYSIADPKRGFFDNSF